MNDPRDARPESSQFHRTGWIAQPVHKLEYAQRSIPLEQAAACWRTADPLLVFNMAIFNVEDGWSVFLIH